MLTGITDADFREKIEDTAAGLLFCYKKLCPYCGVTRAALEKFGSSMPTLTYLSLDIEDNPQARKELKVERAPTMLVMKKGRVERAQTGTIRPAEIANLYSGI